MGEPARLPAGGRALRRARHRGPAVRRGPGRRLAALDGHAPPLAPRDDARPSATTTASSPATDDHTALRPDARQGHRPRPDPPGGRRPPGRAACARCRSTASRTNRDYLVDVLRSDDFLAGDTRTDFVERTHPLGPATSGRRVRARVAPLQHRPRTRTWPRRRSTGSDDGVAVGRPPVAVRALRLAQRGGPGAGAPTARRRPGDWPTPRSGSPPQSVSFLVDGGRWDVEYARVSRDHPLAVRRRADGGPGTTIDLFNVAIKGPGGQSTTLVELLDLHGQAGHVTPVAGDPDDVELLVHFGRRGHHCLIHAVEDVIYVNSPLGQSELVLVPRFADRRSTRSAGGPVSPLPGRVVAVEVAGRRRGRGRPDPGRPRGHEGRAHASPPRADGAGDRGAGPRR